VVSEGVGVWAPESQVIVRSLTRWICRPEERQKVVVNCRRTARPNASKQIALVLGAQVGLTDQPREVSTF
jgi:hypothetical protein